MPAPVMSLGTPGGVLNLTSVAKGAVVAAFLDLSAAWEGQLACEMSTGAAAPTAGTVFSASKVYGNATPNKFQQAAAQGATTIHVTSNAGLHQGQKIALIAASSGAGEVVTISGAVTGTAGNYAVPIAGTASGGGTLNAYAINDLAYLMVQTPSTPSVMPAGTAGTWAINTDYSLPMTLGTGQWILAASNTDATQSVAVTVSMDKVTAYQ